MNDGFVEHTIHWMTTPNQLREIADKMEKKYQNAKPGDSTIVKRIEFNVIDGIIYSIDIHYDQEHM